MGIRFRTGSSTITLEFTVYPLKNEKPVEGITGVNFAFVCPCCKKWLVIK